MSDNNDGTAAADTSAEGAGSETTPGTKPTTGEDPVALARKRQAGAEAARQKAEEARDAALAELEKYRSAERSQADKDLADNAKLQERLTAAERRAEEAERKAEGRILDIKYPNARAELPDVTDEVKLARFEALLAGDGEESKEPPQPQNPNESNRAASGDASGSQPKEESSQDILARLKTMQKPDWLS